MAGSAAVVCIGLVHNLVEVTRFLVQLVRVGMLVVWHYVHTHHVLFLHVIRVRVFLFLCVLHILFDNCRMWFVVEEEGVLLQGHIQGRDVAAHSIPWLA